MKRTLIRLLTISCLLAAGSLKSVAQEKKPRPDKAEIQADVIFKVIAPKFAIGKVVKGAPYSATAITEHVQTLSDGNQIIRKNESKLYRDSEGRTRTEQTLGTIGKWTSGGEAQQHIIITDPVAGVSYSLDPRTHTAHKFVFRKKELPADAQKKLSADAQSKTITINGQTVTQAEFEAMAEKKRMAKENLLKMPRKEAPNDPEVERQIDMFQPGIPRIEAGQGQKKEESLGTQTIEGVTAEGTRLTFTVPAGEIGNTLPMELVRETWYSPELQLVVMSKFRDPRSGETTYRLTNLTRSEPDRSLFGVPADYNVNDGKKPPISKPMKEEE